MSNLRSYFGEDFEEIAKKIKLLKDIPRFIAFEGIDGSGKTTHAKLLRKFLRTLGFSVVLVKDPGTTQLGEKIRRILKSNLKISSTSELFLFLAARRQLVEDVIRPALRQGKIVISDRFTHSTLAYQGRGKMLLPETLPMLCFIASGGTEPELNIVLDVAPEVGLKRVKDRYSSDGGNKDRFELENLDFHRRLRDYYIEISRREPNVILVDASKDVLETFKDVVIKICEFSSDMQFGNR